VFYLSFGPLYENNKENRRMILIKVISLIVKTNHQI